MEIEVSPACPKRPGTFLSDPDKGENALMGKGDYHGASHLNASRAGSGPRREYREFDFEPAREAEKDELLRSVRRPELTIPAGYLRRPAKKQSNKGK